jgi:hypothetical protein
MENLHEEKFIITVKTKNKLTEEDLVKILTDLKSRIEGYSTKGVKALVDADIFISYSKP